MASCIGCGHYFESGSGTTTLGPYAGLCVNCKFQRESIDLLQKQNNPIPQYTQPSFTPEPLTQDDYRVMAWIAVLGFIAYCIWCIISWTIDIFSWFFSLF